MRTNIDIDDALMDAAMRAGNFRTKKDAVDAGLRLLARKAAYQSLLAARGKMNWDLGGDWTQDASGTVSGTVSARASKAAQSVQEPASTYPRKPARAARKP
jgi:antitoxin ParD1/3/4